MSSYRNGWDRPVAPSPNDQRRDVWQRMIWLYGEVRRDEEDIRAWRNLGKGAAGPRGSGGNS